MSHADVTPAEQLDDWENPPYFIAFLRRNIFTAEDLVGFTPREIALLDQGNKYFSY
jgi:hypothetical protein